ncbi:MAG: ribulose phosphate epimerase [Chloroflexi bacterium]|nr:MAG: ribulose phosphate epimerase [Chloroflexota bacterium]
MVSVSSVVESANPNEAAELFTYRLYGQPRTAHQEWLWQGLHREMQRQGLHYLPEEHDRIRLVVNFASNDEPNIFRRKAQGIFVVTFVEDDHEPSDILRAGYPVLVRNLSNLAIYVVVEGGKTNAHFLTMEQGHYVVSHTAGEPEEPFFAEVYERMEPLATSTLVINNVYVPDLPEELWDGDEVTRTLTWAGSQLDKLNLLPAPWPIHEILSERDLRHVKRLYGIGGISYGNLSARRDEKTFWMSASGVNKSNLREIGRDILLVTDYDPERIAMLLSVPPHVEPRRVSVDAIEHFMIYREHPSVGAIIHVHAWMDGIQSTHINYPCGTRELAVAVADLVRQAPDPSRAVVGLKNHGLTITGHSLHEIFERIEGKILPQVPMS